MPDQTTMLKLADNDTGGNARLSSEPKYRSSVTSYFGQPAAKLDRQKSVRCELVRFRFHPGRRPLRGLQNETILIRVKQQVTGLMEKGKPELVVCQVPERQQQDGLVWS